MLRLQKLNFPFQCLLLPECSSVLSNLLCFLGHLFLMLYDFKHHQNRHLFLGAHLQVRQMSQFCLWEYHYVTFPCRTSVMREMERQNKKGEYENSPSAEVSPLSLPIGIAWTAWLLLSCKPNNSTFQVTVWLENQWAQLHSLIFSKFHVPSHSAVLLTCML